LDDADVTAKAGPKSVKPEGGAYARARAAYSGPSRTIEAIEEGESILSKSPEEIRDIVSNLPSGDREFFKLGAANALKRNPNVLRRVAPRASDFGNDIRDKLRPLFGS